MYTFMLKKKLDREVTLSALAIIAFILLICDCIMYNATPSDSIPCQGGILHQKLLCDDYLSIIAIAVFNFFNLILWGTLNAFFLLVHLFFVMRIDKSDYITFIVVLLTKTRDNFLQLILFLRESATLYFCVELIQSNLLQSLLLEELNIEFLSNWMRLFNLF